MADFSKGLLERYPQLEKVSPANLIDQLEELAPRERNLVVGAIVCIIALFAYFIISKGVAKIHSLEDQVKANQRVVAEIQNLSTDFKERNSQVNKFRSRIRPSQGFYLASFIENELTRFQAPLEKMSSEARSDFGSGMEEVSVDVIVQRISFPKMLSLLMDIENNNNALLRIKRVHIKSIPNDPVLVTLDFRVSAYTQK